MKTLKNQLPSVTAFISALVLVFVFYKSGHTQPSDGFVDSVRSPQSPVCLETRFAAPIGCSITNRGQICTFPSLGNAELYDDTNCTIPFRRR